MIAALFVDPKGPYFGRDGVDPWDESRDAREYPGRYPVVAHPPCQLWVNLAGVNFKRYGGTHNRPGNDNGCFARALEAVRRWGGGARASGKLLCVEHLCPDQAAQERRLAPGLAPGMGLRGMAIRLRPPGEETDLAALRGEPRALRAQLAAEGGHASGRMVRPQQADAREARRERDATGFRGDAPLSREPLQRGNQ